MGSSHNHTPEPSKPPKKQVRFSENSTPQNPATDKDIRRNTAALEAARVADKKAKAKLKEWWDIWIKKEVKARCKAEGKFDKEEMERKICAEQDKRSKEGRPSYSWKKAKIHWWCYTLVMKEKLTTQEALGNRMDKVMKKYLGHYRYVTPEDPSEYPEGSGNWYYE